MPFVVPLPQARIYDFPPGSVTVCPLFSGHDQGNDVGVGSSSLVELLVELLAESLAELEVAEADSPLLVSEDPVKLDMEDVSEIDVVAMVSVDAVETDWELELEAVVPSSDVVADAESVPELELEAVVLPSVVVSDAESVPELELKLEVVTSISVDIDDELTLELELNMSVMVSELVLTDIVRVSTEDVLPMAEPELEEPDELLGGPAEYTVAPAGWGIR